MFDSTDPTQLPFLEPTPADGGACTFAAAMKWGEMGMVSLSFSYTNHVDELSMN